jgi:hypothetical protein
MKIAANWTDDCQGKRDFDGDVVRISTRYWPRGGGFSMSVDGGVFTTNADKTIPPSATSSIELYHKDEDGDDTSVTLTECEFEGETFEEVSAKVEDWGGTQFDRIVKVLQKEFEVQATRARP